MFKNKNLKFYSSSSSSSSSSETTTSAAPRRHRRRRRRRLGERKGASSSSASVKASTTTPTTQLSSRSSSVNVIVKICGVTTKEDCRCAIDAGATHVGMILWPKSKRSIAREVAKEIVEECKKKKSSSSDATVTPVAVFVDEDGETITEICEDIGCDHAQLHGEKAREALKDIPNKIKVIWVCSADESGRIVTKLPGESEEELTSRRAKMLSGEQGWKAAIDWVNGPRKTVDYVLVDGLNAGSGERFEWSNLKVPRGCSRKGWILAGGLTPENCSEAVMVLRPNGVDVASGVCDESGVKKSVEKCNAFVSNVKVAASK